MSRVFFTAFEWVRYYMRSKASHQFVEVPE